MVSPKGEPTEVMAAMVNDRDLTGDRLLLGLTVAHLHTASASGQVRWKDAAWKAVGEDERFLRSSCVDEGVPREIPGGHLGWLREVVTTDLPRYEPPRHNLEAGCSAPTPRKKMCGRPIGTGPRFYEPDPQTGRLKRRQFCHRHREQAKSLKEEIRSRPEPPTPAANRGGVLARYLDTDWSQLYRWADPDWAMPPSGAPQARPALRVLVTDETDYVPPHRLDGPVLALVPRG